jgi:hypothetical protein
MSDDDSFFFISDNPDESNDEKTTDRKNDSGSRGNEAPPEIPLAWRVLIHNSWVVRSRANGNGTVEGRLKAIIGSTLRQKELKALRQGLFKDLLPAMTRDERRNKAAHLMALESRRAEVLAFLDKPEVIPAVVEAVLTSRYNNPKKREGLEMHIAFKGN